MKVVYIKYSKVNILLSIYKILDTHGQSKNKKVSLWQPFQDGLICVTEGSAIQDGKVAWNGCFFKMCQSRFGRFGIW